MIELDITAVKKRALDILIDIKDVCTRNGIDYYLAYGTLIGAVRHQGFIPWDDDIDIWIPMNQYSDFIESMKKQSKFRVINYTQDDMCTDLWAKVEDPKTLVVDKKIRKNQHKETVRGIAVDVFPLYETNGSEKEYKRIRKMFFKYTKMYEFSLGRASTKAIFYCMYLKLVRQNIRTLKDSMLDYVSNLKGSYYRVIGPGCKRGDIYPKNCFADKIRLNFDGYEFDAPAGYDELLTHQYGDYMMPPPENNRIRKHDVNVYDVGDMDRNAIIKEFEDDAKS